MIIAHISDFHVFADKPETALVRLDAAEAARAVIADICAFVPKIEAIMFTGDLADGGSAADYELIKEILKPLDVPIFVVPGNHDKRAGMRAAFGDALPMESSGFLNYETEINNIRILALDTLKEGHGEGELCAERLSWLEDKFSAPTGRLTLILMHHPHFPSGNAALDRNSLCEGRDAFEKIISKCTDPLLIFAGHIHRPYQAMWNNIFCAVGGGPSFQFDLDLSEGAPEPKTVKEPYAYFIHRFDKNQNLAVHPRYVSIG